MLVDKPQPHTWLHCDAIALAFCSYILLQQAQVRYLLKLPHVHELSDELDKAGLALTYSRRMAWDMVKVAIRKTEREDVERLPFAGLCCVLRAGMAVVDTKWCLDGDIMTNVDDVVLSEELEGFRRMVRWFGRRWGVGRKFEERLNDCKGC
jgi:hypothetical protein